jgi:hypothetical protein
MTLPRALLALHHLAYAHSAFAVLFVMALIVRMMEIQFIQLKCLLSACTEAALISTFERYPAVRVLSSYLALEYGSICDTVGEGIRERGFADGQVCTYACVRDRKKEEGSPGSPQCNHNPIRNSLAAPSER